MFRTVCRPRPRLDVRAEVPAARERRIVRLHAVIPSERCHGSLGQVNGGHVERFVREDSPNHAVREIRCELARVCLVRQRDEPVHDARLQQIRPAALAVAGDHPHVRVARELPQPDEASALPRARRVRELESFVLRGHASFAGAAGPVVLVVEPHLHSAAPGAVGERTGDVKEFASQIVELQPARGIHHERIDAPGGECRQLALHVRRRRTSGQCKKHRHAPLPLRRAA